MTDEIETKDLSLDQITADPTVQPRTKLNPSAVTRYQADMMDGAFWPSCRST